jgi:tetratricopeptide (TPR) repeat protein
VAALGDVYAAAGRPDQASEQYTLVEVIDKLYRAGGVNTDLQLATFYLDHGFDLERAATMARESYEQAPNVQAAGVYAWALSKTGKLTEARAMSQESLRLGTPDATLHYYAAKIAHALGDKTEARTQINRAMALNPNFSLVLASDARRLQDELRNAK